jgi:hypothetical protein|tara:strand:+ start:265 stop:372 length:108 start_codon:yes stop_codon:yes gene_type:complete
MHAFRGGDRIRIALAANRAINAVLGPVDAEGFSAL